MCVIMAVEGKETPQDAAIVAAAKVNSHGCGMAWLEEGKVRWEKEIPLSGVLRAVRELPRPLVVHFRLASAGGIRPELCHPFPVEAAPRTDLSGFADEVLFHNGTVAGWEAWLNRTFKGKIPAGAWSDSRLMAHVAASGFDLEKGLPLQRSLRLDKMGRIRKTGLGWCRMKGATWSNDFWLQAYYWEAGRPSREASQVKKNVNREGQLALPW